MSLSESLYLIHGRKLSAAEKAKYAQCSRCYGTYLKENFGQNKDETKNKRICDRCINFSKGNRKLKLLKDKIPYKKVKVIKKSEIDANLANQFSTEMNSILDSISKHIFVVFHNAHPDIGFIESLFKMIIQLTNTDIDTVLLWLNYKVDSPIDHDSNKDSIHINNINISSNVNSNDLANENKDMDNKDETENNNYNYLIDRKKISKLLNISWNLAGYSKKKKTKKQAVQKRPPRGYRDMSLVSMSIKDTNKFENIFSQHNRLLEPRNRIDRTKNHLLSGGVDNKAYILNKYYKFYSRLLLGYMKTCNEKTLDGSNGNVVELNMFIMKMSIEMALARLMNMDFVYVIGVIQQIDIIKDQNLKQVILIHMYFINLIMILQFMDFACLWIIY